MFPCMYTVDHKQATVHARLQEGANRNKRRAEVDQNLSYYVNSCSLRELQEALSTGKSKPENLLPEANTS